MPTKLHLGCGNKKLSGWVNIDSVPSCQPDIVHDLAQPLPFANLSVDEILAEDLLEHFDKYMRFLVFEDWARVLKLGGIIHLQVPNFEKILWRYFKFGFERFVDFIFGENMWRSEHYLGHFGNHKWGYSEKTLKDFVALFGIKVVSLEKRGLNLSLKGEKIRHVPTEEIDQILVYSHANATGQGQASLPLRIIREKIKIYQSLRP